jgi:hypothetical protein
VKPLVATVPFRCRLIVRSTARIGKPFVSKSGGIFPSATRQTTTRMPSIEITATLAGVAMIAAPRDQACRQSANGRLMMVRVATESAATAVVLSDDRTDRLRARRTLR